MGNSRSQPCRRSRPMYLFYLIHRTWTGKTGEHVDKEDRDDTIDPESESSSRCSDCKSCHYRQDSLTFDSESEMAPNAEEELLGVKPWGPQPEKERLRPPTYNAEDYAIALRRWGRRPVVTSHESSHGTLPSTTSSSSGYASGSGEMTLRQFTSVSELLNKLRADLRLAFPSFVQEFASPPADGITLLLETLRGVQLIQSSPPSNSGAGPRIGTRRAALDELGCVECLAACGERCPDAPRLLSQAQPGLLALAVCLTSSLNRSRVLALQLLTKVCQAPGGHLAVSEAVSTLRLRYGEGGRFRFLAGALLAPRAAVALRVAGISFLNAFLKSASRPQTRLYIQAEACEAGLEPRILQSWLTETDIRSEEALSDLLHKEVQKWSKNCVDIEALQKRLARAEETCAMLGAKVTILQGQLEKCQREKMNTYSSTIDDRGTKSSCKTLSDKDKRVLSSNAEDEGISSSERSSSPEELETMARNIEKHPTSAIDNDQETTIDDVIEELRIIVKDAEEEYEDRKCMRENSNIRENMTRNPEKLIDSRLSIESSNREIQEENDSQRLRLSIDEGARNNQITYFGRNDDVGSVDSAITRKLSSTPSMRNPKTIKDCSVKIVVKSPDVEDAIVPAILYPQPPRRAPPCLSTIMATREGDFLDHPIIYGRQDEDDLEEETLGDGSDSLLSASRLKYNAKNEISDSPTIVVEETANYYEKNLGIVEAKSPNDKRNIRNYDSSSTKNHRTIATKYHEIYRQFENKTNDFSHHTDKRVAKKDETEKQRLMRRSVSHDALGTNVSSPNSGKSSSVGSRIESRVRKFENLNAFENSSMQNFARNDNGTPCGRGRFGRFVGAKTRMQRSESFHHVSLANDKRDEGHLTRGGSDSGLLYITDYDLEPLVTRNFVRDSSPRSINLLTKSLERIDEGRDSVVIDGTIVQGKRCQTVRSLKDKQTKNAKSRNDEKSLSKLKSGLSKITPKKLSDKVTNGKLLKNDELYDDVRNGRNSKWSFQNELDGSRGMNDFLVNRDSTSAEIRQNVTSQDCTKFSNGDKGVFLPSGRYDAFGLGKNRFNAGKYSGHHPRNAQDNIGVRRNSASTLVAKRGKVTDILSGLY